MSDPSRRFRGEIWDAEQQRYVVPDEHVKIDANGVKRDYGAIPDHAGNLTRCGLPGDQRVRARRERILPDGTHIASGTDDGAFGDGLYSPSMFDAD